MYWGYWRWRTCPACGSRYRRETPAETLCGWCQALRDRGRDPRRIAADARDAAQRRRAEP